METDRSAKPATCIATNTDNVVAKETFNYVDTQNAELYGDGVRRHPEKDLRWIVGRYFSFEAGAGFLKP
nr:hypothetical protein J4W40_000320 [Escherichia coli]